MIRYIFVILIALAGCTSQTDLPGIEDAIKDSRQAFDSAIPSDWNIDNYSDRVVRDYISRGGNGFLATDITGKITSFHMCDGYTNKKCLEFAANEARGKCENTVALAIIYRFIPSQPPDCRVVAFRNKVIGHKPFAYNGRYYNKNEFLF